MNIRALNALSLLLLIALSPASNAEADFTGIWEMDTWITDLWDNSPPFTEAGLAAQKAWEADPNNDPTHQCLFHLVRITSAPFLHEVIMQDKRVTILYEYHHQIRRVYMDGRGHPEDLYSSLMGHSIGWWEDDTLVIDTVGVSAGYLRPQGFPHTENLRVVERHTLIGDGLKKQIEMTIIDPEYYREPWSVTLTFSQVEAELDNYDCLIRPYLPPEAG